MVRAFHYFDHARQQHIGSGQKAAKAFRVVEFQQLALVLYRSR